MAFFRALLICKITLYCMRCRIDTKIITVGRITVAPLSSPFVKDLHGPSPPPPPLPDPPLLLSNHKPFSLSLWYNHHLSSVGLALLWFYFSGIKHVSFASISSLIAAVSQQPASLSHAHFWVLRESETQVHTPPLSLSHTHTHMVPANVANVNSLHFLIGS